MVSAQRSLPSILATTCGVTAAFTTNSASSIPGSVAFHQHNGSPALQPAFTTTTSRGRSSLFMTVGATPEPWDGSADQDDSKTFRHSVRRQDANEAFSPPASPDATPYDGLDGALPLPNLPPSEARLERINKEADAQSRFLQGDELFENRKLIAKLKLELNNKYADHVSKNNIEHEILEKQQLDAEFVYYASRAQMEEAERSGQENDVDMYREEVMEARSCLPHFNMEGLWVGKYGEHGYEMINVTYSGDMLVAYKVTGDKNVPKGEVTFTANLDPNAPGSADLSAIELTEVAASQWGTKYLPRFPGKGQVAAEGFENSQWVDGQLIMVGEYFSFAWVPIGHQIFFGRPSAELILKMLKNSELSDMGTPVEAGGEKSDSIIAKMRVRAARCMEETQLMMEDDELIQGTSSGEREQVDFFSQEGCFE